MNSARTCGKCAAPISAHAPEILYLRSLMESALEADAEFDEPAGAAPLGFGDYELLSELGRGGQGVVYRAQHKTLNRIVALKCISVEFTSPDRLKRFRIEAEAAARLEHPGMRTHPPFSRRPALTGVVGEGLRKRARNLSHFPVF